MNALTRENEIVIDFLGEQKDPVRWDFSRDFYFQLSIQSTEDGKSEKLNLDYTYDDRGTQTSTDVKTQADLERAD